VARLVVAVVPGRLRALPRRRKPTKGYSVKRQGC
jgi:hypothetical protein